MSDGNGPPGYEPLNMGSARPEDLNGVPAPGSLGLKEKRSWKTWQLAVAVLGAALLGMLINYRTVGASAGGSGGSKTSDGGAYSLPPAGGGSTTTTGIAGGSSTSTTASGGAVTTTTASGGGGSNGSTTTTTAGSSTSTTTGSTTATTIPPARLLLGPTQSQGNWTSPAFTITAPSWNIGWAFQCSPVPTAGTSFEVFVTQAGAAQGGVPAITETGGSGQSVTAQSSLGKQTLVVEAPANCAWAIKVTGS